MVKTKPNKAKVTVIKPCGTFTPSALPFPPEPPSTGIFPVFPPPFELVSVAEGPAGVVDSPDAEDPVDVEDPVGAEDPEEVSAVVSSSPPPLGEVGVGEEVGLVKVSFGKSTPNSLQAPFVASRIC